MLLFWRSFNRRQRMVQRRSSHPTTTSMILLRHVWTSPMLEPSNSSLISSKTRTSWTRSGMKAFLTTQPWIAKDKKDRSSERTHRSLLRKDESPVSKRSRVKILWQTKSAWSSTSNNRTNNLCKIRVIRILLSQTCANRRLIKQRSLV